MIAIAIGLFITLVMATIFASTSRSFGDLQKSREQIENGRYALSLLSEEIRHAGYYGQLGVLAAPVAAVDPCLSPTLTDLYYPVQVYSTALTAKVTPMLSCLTATEVSVGSDILVVRRSSTIPLAATDVAATNQLYLQADPTIGAIQLGGGVVVGTDKAADGNVATILQKNGVTAAPINKLNVFIYYVSPCSQATCGNSGDGVPTLKRIELTTGGGAPVWSTPVPLVSGIEFMQLDLGMDTFPTDTSTVTGARGDGAADGAFTETFPGGATLTQAWNEVVSMRINILARTLETVPGFVDTGRTYNLGAAGTLAGSGAYKRHVFSTEVRLNNVAGRRERVLGE